MILLLIIGKKGFFFFFFLIFLEKFGLDERIHIRLLTVRVRIFSGKISENFS